MTRAWCCFFYGEDGASLLVPPANIVAELARRGMTLVRMPEWDEDGKPAFVATRLQ